MGPAGSANHTAKKNEMRVERRPGDGGSFAKRGATCCPTRGLRRNWAHGLPSPSDRSPHHFPRRCVENSKRLRTGGGEGISTGPPPHLAMMFPFPRTSSSSPPPFQARRLCLPSSDAALVFCGVRNQVKFAASSLSARCSNPKETTSV